MPTPRFRPEPDLKIELGIRSQREFRMGMRERADLAAAVIEAVAPERTGYYRRRIKARGDRVWSEDVFWHLVEFGSINNPAYGPLRRGLMTAGFDFKPSPRP